MKAFLPASLAALALSALLPAQTRVDVTLATVDASGVHANRQTDAVRAGTVVERALRLTAHDGRTVSASSLAAPDSFRTPAGAAAGARFVWAGHAAGGGSAGTIGGAPLAAGAQTYGMLLRSREPVRGSVVIQFSGRTDDAAVAGARVTVGNEVRAFRADGQAHRAHIDAGIGGDGLRVRVEILGSARSRGRVQSAYGAHLKVFFVARDGGGGGPECEVTPHERSCPAGGRLAGRAEVTRQGGVLGLALTDALPNAIGITLISPSGRTFPIGRTDCIFFGDAIVHGVFRTDRTGAARTRIDFPLRAGAGFYVHQATVIVAPSGLQFGTSNSLEVRCR